MTWYKERKPLWIRKRIMNKIRDTLYNLEKIHEERYEKFIKENYVTLDVPIGMSKKR